MTDGQLSEKRQYLQIAYLSKRKKTPKDMINDRFARLYEIPNQLSQLGHDVYCYCLSYHGHPSGFWSHNSAVDSGRLDWEARSLTRDPSIFLYPWQLLRKIRRHNPDVVIAASDMPHVILGAWLAKRLGCRFVADLYDDFESYGQARIPGMTRLFRDAVHRADLITTVSDQLTDLVIQRYAVKCQVLTLPSSINTEMFYPMDQADCRRQLGLPQNAELIGTAGDLKASRGIDTLYAGWQQLVSDNPNCHLVVAGPIDKNCPPPDHERVHYIGQLDNSTMSVLFNALDVGVVYLVDDAFGQNCFPQKSQEMMACNLPMIAANVGVMPDMMANAQHALYRAGDAADLARAAQSQFKNHQIVNESLETWHDAVSNLECALQKL